MEVSNTGIEAEIFRFNEEHGFKSISKLKYEISK
jgi:hypothetical protein